MIVGLVIGGILLYILLGTVSFGFFRILLEADEDDGGFLSLMSVIWPVSIVVALIVMIGSYIKPFFCFFADFGSRLGLIAGSFVARRNRAMISRRARQNAQVKQRWFFETGTNP